MLKFGRAIAVTRHMSFARRPSAGWLRAAIVPLFLISASCGDDEGGGDDGARDGGRDGGGESSGGERDGAVANTDRDGNTEGDAASIDGPSISMRLTAPSALPRNLRAAIQPGAAWGEGLASLKYLIRGIQICESLEGQGSGFSNPRGCLELYHGDESALPYGLDDDFTPLGDRARALTTGYIDLLDPDDRANLATNRTLSGMDVRDYNFGIITWALPIKFTATVSLTGGDYLYSHDGESRSELLGADMYRNYYTAPSSSLVTGPAEEAVVLLPNGGNWFKFQSPLRVTQEDIDEGRGYVLDLVFNPDGIVKGFSGDGVYGQLRESNDAGRPVRSMTVPMLDLAPVPHRADEFVVRESYQGSLTLDGSSFDVRFELYSVDGDDSGTIYGVDTKTLISDATTEVPPEFSKVTYIESDADGSLKFLSFKSAPIVTGFRRAAAEGDVTSATIVCATHQNRAGAEGGAAIVVNQCPADTLPIALTLRSRRRIAGNTPVSVPTDAGIELDGGVLEDAAADGDVADAEADLDADS